MSESRAALKVGLFVIVGLVLLGVLVVLFSKGTTFSGRHIQLQLKSGNVGSIKRGASVVMSGVPVGYVSGIDLGDEGTNVLIFLEIRANRKIRDDAQFEIEQQGFLGEQYVAIYPGLSRGQLLKNGDVVICRTPFNLQETVAKAAETINRIGQVTTNVNAAVADVRRLVLTEERLNQLSSSLENFSRLVSDARITVSNITMLVNNNSAPVATGVSNLSYFTGQLPGIVARVDALIMTNETDITTAIRNIESGTTTLTNILTELQGGKGFAGRLLRDEKMAQDLTEIAHNLSLTTSNLALTSARLNTHGLWGILWKQKSSSPPPENTGMLRPRFEQ
jgi:phospholipid/cholesterol/gamma-HCH transport system substrate-binding protein